MPVPVSVTSMQTKGRLSRSTSLVVIVRRPPAGIASRPLSAMFSTTCASWSGSVSTEASVSAREVLELDFASERPREHGLESADDLVHVEPLGEQHLLAAEREQLPRQRRCMGGGLPDLVDVVGARVALVEGVREQLRIARDRREHVVEVVGDAAGELADRLHLLRLPQLLLELLLLGDVEEEALVADDRAVLVADRDRLVEHPDDASVARDEPELAARGNALLARLAGERCDSLAVVWMDAVVRELGLRAHSSCV